jgi:DNA-binding NtrC family response regulator
VIGATNRDIEESVASGEFRADLFYRLNVLTVTLPPLRERTGDVALLVDHLVRHFRQEFRKPLSRVEPKALALLEEYHWPGNVRELRNAVERAALLCDGEVLRAEDFGALSSRGPLHTGFRLPPEGLRFDALERDLVAQALERTDGNQTRAAALLGMNRDQIRYRIEKFGLPHPQSSGRSASRTETG